MGSLAILSFRYRHIRPRVRQDLEILVSENAERAKFFEAKFQKATEVGEEDQKTIKLLLARIDELQALADELREERNETWKEKAELFSEVTFQTNQVAKFQHYEKKYNDLKWQLENTEKKEDRMKGLESECRWMEKQLAKAKADRDNLRSLQIITETEVENLERSILEKDGELSKKETELRAARRTRNSDEVAVQKAHRMVFLLSAKAHKERRSALKAQRMFRQAKQAAKHAPAAHQDDALTPHECDHSPYIKTIKLQVGTIADLRKQVDAKATSTIPDHICDHSSCDLLKAAQAQTITRLDGKVSKLQSDLDCSESSLEHLKEEYAKLQSTIEDDFEAYLVSDNEEVKDEPAAETSEVPLEDHDPDNEVPELARLAAHEVPLPEATDADIEGQQSLLEDRDATIDQLRTSLKDEEARRKVLEAKNAEHICDHSQCSSQANKKDGRIQELSDELERADGRTEELLTTLANERKANEKNRQIANLSTMMAAPSEGNERTKLKRDLDAKVIQCEGLQLSLDDRDATIANLNRDISTAGSQFSDLKLSLGMPSAYGITEVASELTQRMTAFEGLSHEARNHVCDHSQCHRTRSQLELQNAGLQKSLDDAGAKYAGLENTVKEMDIAIKRRNAQIKSMGMADKDKEAKHEQEKKKLFSDIEVAKSQAGLRYETSQPGYRPLRDQLLTMKATLDRKQQDLDKALQDLQARTQERDHEAGCAAGFKADAERFAANAIHEQTAYRDCMKACDELANQKQSCEQEIERLRLQMAELTR